MEAPAGVERGILPSGKQFANITQDVGGVLYEQYNINTVKVCSWFGICYVGSKDSTAKENC